MMCNTVHIEHRMVVGTGPLVQLSSLSSSLLSKLVPESL